MTKLPPPPTVGRGSAPTDDGAPADAPPPPSMAAPDPNDAVIEVRAVSAMPRGEIAAPPTHAAPPPSPAMLRAPTTPPRATLPPTSGGLAPERRTMLTVATVLGTALIAVVIARCSGERGEPLAEATTQGSGTPSAGGFADSPDTRTAIVREGAEGGAAQGEGAAQQGAVDEPAAQDGRDREAATAEGAADDPAKEPSEGEPAPDLIVDDDAPTVDDAPSLDNDPTVDDAPAVPASADPKAARPSARTDAMTKSGSSAPAEPPLTAQESLAKARVAWKAGNARDTYKYANKSRFKQPSDDATELATLAACKMKLDDSAKSSYRLLDGDRKKRTRIACRDFGVRVGL